MLAWDQLRPVVLDHIGDQEVAVSDLRERLAAAGVMLSVLAYHGMLAALERGRLVSGRYEAAAVAGAGEGRLYRLTTAGKVELDAFRSSTPALRDAA